MKLTHTICPSCSVGCGINLITQKQEAVGTYPYKRYPINEGKSCKKGRECYGMITEEKRLLNPHIKKTSLVGSNWDESLNLAVSKIKSYEPEEIGIIGSGNCTNEECEILKKFATSLGAENIGYPAGNFPNFDFETGNLNDVENSQFILITGNVLKEYPLIGRKIILAKENGAEIITIDYPQKTTTGMISDQYIQTESIRQFLDDEAEKIQTKLNESSLILVSKLDNKEELEEFHQMAAKSNSKIIPIMKECNSRGAMNILPPLSEDELKTMINGMNLLYIVGDDLASQLGETLKKVDFLITQSTTLNQTALLSDVVFPSACWVEKTGSFTNITGNTQKVQQILPPPGEAMDDATIIMKIAEKMEIDL
ncbi:MAG: molybdopterin-dependent oxidoreductase [Methanobacterium sp.]|jgi:formate dehydrogenase major subunit|nr:molybdopterin-dependent oxidoreductase [Methanobacterium sp.]